MRGRRLGAALLALLVLGSVTGCGRETEAEPAPPSREPEEIVEPAGPRALTAGEIERVNEAFVDSFVEDGIARPNPLCCLISSYYAAPADIDLSAFLAYCFVTEAVGEEPVGQAEFEALKQQTDRLQHTETPEEMLVPIHRYPRAEVDAFLERYTGVTTADLTASWTWGDLVYVPEYDAYYNFTSDFGPGWFACEAGVREGTVVRLTGKSRTLNYVRPMGGGSHVEAVLTLEEQSDGSWHFMSFLPMEEAEPLTAEEIAEVNEAFTPFFERDGRSYVNPICSFFTSYYERPEDLDLVEFLRYFFQGEQETAEERQALSQAKGWPFGEMDPENLPVPVHKYPRAEVDAFLQAHTGITTEDLDGWDDSTSELMYLPEYDAYYNFTSDCSPGWFECEKGVRDGGTVRLTGYGRELTLEEQPDGSWHFVSFLPLETDG